MTLTISPRRPAYKRIDNYQVIYFDDLMIEKSDLHFSLSKLSYNKKIYSRYVGRGFIGLSLSDFKKLISKWLNQLPLDQPFSPDPAYIVDAKKPPLFYVGMGEHLKIPNRIGEYNQFYTGNYSFNISTYHIEKPGCIFSVNASDHGKIISPYGSPAPILKREFIGIFKEGVSIAASVIDKKIEEKFEFA